MNGETVFKAIAVPGKDQLEKLLQILYVLYLKKNLIQFYLNRGPEHNLLEHPDKDGNLPLMHACAKLDIGLIINYSRNFNLKFSFYRKVELLVKAGANVNNYISSGKTA